nr:F-box/WD repeat-containing protein sel-10-like [Ipomoea trifida]
MAGASPSTQPQDGGGTSITDLDVDALVNCASFLSIQDVLNMALSSKHLQAAAFSDSVWVSFFRKRWPSVIPTSFPQTLGAREAYLSRLAEVQQFKFSDPFVAEFNTEAKSIDNLLFDKNNIIYSQGALLTVLMIDEYLNGRDPRVELRGHTARISCVRLYPIDETPFHRSQDQKNDNLVVTSSFDHSIRIWWKGRCVRCLRGHNGPVSALSDGLLDGCSGKLMASGGEDGTVRLWSLESGGQRGQHALKATLYGHEKPVVLMAVARHRTSLLVSVSKNSKVMVWDTTTSSAARSSCCVGMTTLPGTPVAMKCHESLVYVAAGSSVVGIDLITMNKVLTLKHEEDIHSFQMVPLKSLICTGLTSRAMLWDISKCVDTQTGEIVAELSGHRGRVNLLGMDAYKIVTGGQEDLRINIWETETGQQTNSLICCSGDDPHPGCGFSGMAVDGCRIVTTFSDQQYGVMHFMDFNNATSPVLFNSGPVDQSKFWCPISFSDTDESDREQEAEILGD